MKKNYKLTDLCCANCAAEIERGVAKIAGVKECSVNFIMQKMSVEIDDGANYADLKKKMEKIVKKVEPDCEMVELSEK